VTVTRILYVIGTLDLGGSEGQLVELATGLDRARFAPAVCCLSRGGPHQARLEAAGIRVVVIPFPAPRSAAAFVRSAPCFARLVALIRSVRPEVVHGFLFWGYVLGAFAARLAGVPVVVASRRSLAGFKSRPPYRQLRGLERLANRLTDTVVANSEAVRAETLATEGLAAEKVVVIHNGVDAARYETVPDASLRRTLGVTPAARVVVVVANLIAYKGHAGFLEAWTRVVARVPAAMALLVGDGPLRAQLEARAAALGLGPSVRFLGARRDVPAVLALADVVVHPSLEEGFSNAILEAMAAARPVVASAVGGVPEAVVHEVTGLLTPPGDAEALAAAVVSLLGDPGRSAKLGAAGRQRVMDLFTVGRMLRQYEALYVRHRRAV